MSNFSSSATNQIWQQLEAHHQDLQSTSLIELFELDSSRAKKFNFEFNGLYLDISKQHITQKTIELFCELAEEINYEQKIEAMFKGEKINQTEQRAVLHTALRANSEQGIKVNNEKIFSHIQTERQHIKAFCDEIETGKLTSSNGKAFKHFINIGIGGSDLGPKFVVDALEKYQHADTNSYFVSNIDPNDIETIFKHIDAESALFIISSKSFTTLETLSNAKRAKTWLKQQGIQDTGKHFVAVTANFDKAKDFGINENSIFTFWDWVGGRYSLWSTIGLPIALALGEENFTALLNGANQMDEHFRNTPLSENLPAILSMIDVWNNNFNDYQSLTIVPYDQSLRLLPEYLSQLCMESNGKQVNNEGEVVEQDTMPIVWGGIGTNTQHAFFQLLHQGSRIIPVEFLAPIKNEKNDEQHRLLIANCIAQSQALLVGEPSDNSHKVLPGNRPSTTLFYERLTPKTLGMLIALYEHRTYMQSLFWNINAFDQWGVELGKKLAKDVNERLLGTTDEKELDSSSEHLIHLYKTIN